MCADAPRNYGAWVDYSIDARAAIGDRFRLTAHRIPRRLLADDQVLLATALVIPTIVAAIVFGNFSGLLVLMSASLLGFQLVVRLGGGRVRQVLPRNGILTLRLAADVAFVALASASVGDGAFRPLTSLYILVLAAAAAIGRREGFIIGALGLAAYLAPVLFDGTHAIATLSRGAAVAATALFLAIGVRRTVSALEATLRRLRGSMAAERRRGRQLAGVEAVGRLLAEHGPIEGVLKQVVDLLVDRFGYEYVSVYVADAPHPGDAHLFRLGAQRGYGHPPLEVNGTMGVTGRVVRTGRPEFLPDARGDREFRAAEPGLCAEICAPLTAGGELLGVVNVESMTPGSFDERDLEVVLLVADRIGSALALAHQREELATRATMFQRLTEFSVAINGTLDSDRLSQTIVQAATNVIPADYVELTILDRTTGDYCLKAIEGGALPRSAQAVPLDVGITGRAISERAVVTEHGSALRDLMVETRDGDVGGPLTAVAVPFIRDGVVIGAMSLARRGRTASIRPIELEVIAILGSQTALAVSNTLLHAEVTESSLRDSLTGLYNRRFLDSTLDQLSATRARLEPDDREKVAAILFDLDHFGGFNKRHGHRIGDNVLRAFAAILRDRIRTSDLAARYGGEEFLVILHGTDRASATILAEEIRRRFGEASILGADGERLRATVSAGVTELPAGNAHFESLIETADVGLAMAKQAGRDQVVTT